MTFFQVLSRNNDINGNPYRLVLLYGSGGEITKAYEARSSSPNIVSFLKYPEYLRLPTFHLSASEYNETKRACKARSGILFYTD